MSASQSRQETSFPLSYCSGGWETLDRLTRLYEQRAPDLVCAVFRTPSRALERFAREHSAGFCGYPDPVARIAFWDDYWRERAAIADDAVPSAYLTEFDQGLYGGLVGGEVRFLCNPDNGWISSMVPPLFPDLPAPASLRFDLESVWFRRYREQMDVFVRHAAGKFGITHLILIDGLNFLFELVGATKTYEALLDAPARVRETIDFAYELNVKVQEAFFARVPLVVGGTCSNQAEWVPGRIVNESVDPFHLMSAAYFEQWGREPVERIFARFDGGVVHLHANGRHLLRAVSTLRGLKGARLGDFEKEYPPAFSLLPVLKAEAGDLPLAVGVDYPQFCQALERHELPGGVLYVVRNTPDADAANRVMERVREYRL